MLQVAAQVIGNDTAITIGGMQGHFELNVRVPLIARNLLESIHLLPTASTAFAEKCVDGDRRPTRRAPTRSAESHARRRHRAQPVHRLRQGAEIVKEAAESGRTLREVALEHGVDAETLRRAIDLRRIAAGSQADAQADGKPSRPRRSSGSSNGARRAAAGLSAPRRRAAAPRRPPASRGRRR